MAIEGLQLGPGQLVNVGPAQASATREQKGALKNVVAALGLGQSSYLVFGELLSNVVYGVGQAAFLSDSSSTCTPSLNFTLFTTNVSSANPLSRFHFFFATSSSL